MRMWWRKRKPRPERPLLVAVLSILAGVAIGGWVVYGAHTDGRLISRGDAVDGAVLTVREESVGRPRDGLRETIAEVRYTVPGPYGPSPQRLEQLVRTGWPVPRDYAPAAEPGQTVTVYYDPSDPSQAVVDGWERRYASWWLALALLCGLGGVLGVHKARQEAFVRRRARRIQASW